MGCGLSVCELHGGGINSLLLAVAFLAISGCTDGIQATAPAFPQSPVSPSGALRTIYPDVNGEGYPDSEMELATITFAKSDFIYPNCDFADNSCTITLTGEHQGSWNRTEMIFTVANDGASAPAQVFSAAPQYISCFAWGYNHGPYCAKYRMYVTEDYHVRCGSKLAANVVHKAWWLGYWDISFGVLTMPGGRIGEVQTTTFPQTFEAPVCHTQTEGSGGGGGGGSSGGCVSYYAIWYDPDTGAIVDYEYLYTICGGYLT